MAAPGRLLEVLERLAGGARVRGKLSKKRAVAAVAAGVWARLAFPWAGGLGWAAAAAAGAAWPPGALALLAAAGVIIHLYRGEYDALAIDWAALGLASGFHLASAGLPRGPKSRVAAAVSAFIVVLPLVATLYVVRMVVVLVEAINAAPLTLREVLYPVQASVAGRLVLLLAVAGVSVAVLARALSLIAVVFGGPEGARRIAVQEAMTELEEAAKGRDYSFSMLREAYALLAAVLVAPAIGIAVDSLTGRLEGAPEPVRVIAPLLYFMAGWLAVRALTPTPIFRGLKSGEPGPSSALAMLAAALAGAAAMALFVPGGRDLVSLALGLGGSDPTAAYAAGVEAEYMERLRALVAILEFAVRFFGGG